LARKRLAEEGYDPQFGARPLKRAIQDLLLNPLAQRLLAGDFKPRDTVIVSANAAGDLEFTASEPGQV
jgi:ATP-dependent Clp protease ATP-binding subunit ClpA